MKNNENAFFRINENPQHEQATKYQYPYYCPNDTELILSAEQKPGRPDQNSNQKQLASYSSRSDPCKKRENNPKRKTNLKNSRNISRTNHVLFGKPCVSSNNTKI
jgi:hypothetical protein